MLFLINERTLVGLLVFYSVVIRIGCIHYHALIGALMALGPNPIDCTLGLFHYT